MHASESKSTEYVRASDEGMKSSAPPELSIRLDKIGHHFGTRRVFRGIDFEVASGQVCTVTGPNGSGKSTLLRIIAGLLAASEGNVSVTVNGREQSPGDRRNYLGYVSPDLTLYRELTAAENLQFFAQLRGVALTREDLIERLTQVGLRGRGRDLVGTYSSGMRQRLKYAFALLANPPILLLDEPTANLDVSGIAIVEAIVAAQRNRAGGGLTILATNEPRELEWGDMTVRVDAEA
jgi:heme exporter protein A